MVLLGESHDCFALSQQGDNYKMFSLTEFSSLLDEMIASATEDDDWVNWYNIGLRG